MATQVTWPVVAPSSPGQVVAYTGTAGTIANAIPSTATALWIFVTSIAHIRVGTSPTAVTTDFPLPANTPIIFPLTSNDGTLKVSAVQSAAGGNLHVCPIAY